MTRERQRVHLDANVILRFLRNDDPKQSPLAADLFTKAQEQKLDLIVSSVIILEVFYVLAETYGLQRTQVAKILETFICSGLVSCENDSVVIDALRRITSNKISFGDAYLAACAVHAQESVASFDRHLTTFTDVKVYGWDEK